MLSCGEACSSGLTVMAVKGNPICLLRFVFSLFVFLRLYTQNKILNRETAKSCYPLFNLLSLQECGHELFMCKTLMSSR